jgi:hypothetical protein
MSMVEDFSTSEGKSQGHISPLVKIMLDNDIHL